MQDVRCYHGNSNVKKLCCSPLCSQPAFVSLSCEQCFNQHEHEGLTTLKTIDLITKDIDKSLAKSSPARQDSIIKKQGELAIQLISAFTNKLAKDVEDMSPSEEVQPHLQRIINRLKQRDPSVVGADISKLLQAVEKQQLYVMVKKTDSREHQIKALMEEFLGRFRGLVDQYSGRRRDILTGKKKDVEVAKIPAKVKKPEKEAPTPSGAVLSPPAQPKPPIKNKQKPKPKVVEEVPKKKKEEKTPNDQEQVKSNNSEDGWYFVQKVVKPKATSPSDSPSDEEDPDPSFIYIEDIKPGAEGFNIIAKVLSTTKNVVNDKTFVKCILGDESGIVTASFFPHELLVKDSVLQLRNLRAYVDYGNIILNTIRPNSLSISKEKIEEINRQNNISAKQWKKELIY